VVEYRCLAVFPANPAAVDKVVATVNDRIELINEFNTCQYRMVFLTTNACGATSKSSSAPLPKPRLLRGRTLKILRGVREGESSRGSGGGGISKGLEEEEEDDAQEVLAHAEGRGGARPLSLLCSMYMNIICSMYRYIICSM